MANPSPEINLNRISELVKVLNSRTKRLGDFLLKLEKKVLDVSMDDFEVTFGSRRHLEILEVYLKATKVLESLSEATRRSCVLDHELREHKRNENEVLSFIQMVSEKGIDFVRMEAARGGDPTINRILASTMLKAIEGDPRSALFLVQALMGLKTDMPVPVKKPGLLVNLKKIDSGQYEADLSRFVDMLASEEDMKELKDPDSEE